MLVGVQNDIPVERTISGGGPRLSVSVGMDGADVLQKPEEQVDHGDWPNSHLVSARSELS